MSYCTIKPESKLYDEIENRIGNRSNSLFLYELFNSKDFIRDNKESLTFENNEPTFDSIKKFINFDEAATSAAKSKFFTKELNNSTRLLTITEVAEKVVEFNNSHPSYIAEIVSNDKNGNDIIVNETSSDSANKKAALENAVNVYKTINKFLENLGIPLTIIDANIMKYENGLIKPELLYETVDDIFGAINIANNIDGLRSIPEEFCHFIIENIKSDPIIQRTLEQIDDETAKYILGDEYDSVVEYYNRKNRPDLIAREVLGRMYANLLQNTELINPIPYKNLLQRGLEKIKAFILKYFKNASPSVLSSKLESINSILKPLTNFSNLENIITPDTLRQFKNIGDSLANTKKNVDRLKLAFDKSMDNLAAHIAIYRDKEKSSTFDNKELEIYGQLKQDWFSKNYFKGLINYAYESSVLMNNIYDNIHKIAKDLSGTPNKITLMTNAHKLKEIKNFIEAYQEPVMMVFSMLNGLKTGQYTLPEGIYVSEDDKANLLREIGNINSLLIQLEDSYKSLGKQTLYHFYKEFFSKDGSGVREDYKQNKIDLFSILEEASEDISTLDRWIQAASSSTDAFIGLIDRAIQDKQQEIRQKTQELEHKIVQLDRTFKVDGGESTSFIYEKDENGIPTRYLINDMYSRVSFNKAKEEFKSTDSFKTASEQGQEDKINNWLSENTVLYDYIYTSTNSKGEEIKKVRSYYVPNPEKYPSKLKLSAAEQKYYNGYIKIKQELDFLLPPQKTSPFMAVQKLIENAQEAILNNKLNTLDMLHNAVKSTTNLIKITDNDEMMYQGSGLTPLQKAKAKWSLKLKEQKDTPIKVLLNFDKSIHMQVPIYYTSLLDDSKMLSQDASSALIDFAVMSINYAGMNEIVDFMEITKDISEIRSIKSKESGRPAKASYVVDGMEHVSDALVNTQKTNAHKRIESLIETQVYGKARSTGSTVLGMDTNKMLDALIKYTAWSMLGFNAFTGINNVVVGKTQMFIEASSRQFFDWKEWLEADAAYVRNIGPVFKELGTPVVSSRLGLIGQMFNVGLHWKESIKDKEFYKNGIENVLSSFNASFMMTAGEHHMQMSTALAMLKHIKMLENGKEVSLYDALETEEITHNGQVVDGKISIRKGVTNLDGSEITQKQIRDIGLQIGKVNQKLHGIYNQEDAMEAKRTAAGRLATMYRNFIVPTVNKRFRGAFGTKVPYDYYFNDYFEGYYLTTFNFIKDSIKKQRYSYSVLRAAYDNLKPKERANIRRMAAEVFNIAMINMALFALVTLGGDGDEPVDTWSARAAYYFLKRNQLEAMFYLTPWSTFETILVSPTAVLSPIQNFGKLFYSTITAPFGGYGSEILESGNYKDHSKLYRDAMKAAPIYNSVYDFMNLNHDDKRFKIFEQ